MLDTVTDLRSILKDPGLLSSKAYVAGEWIDAEDGKTFAVTNPARGDIIAVVPDLAGSLWARSWRLSSLEFSGVHLSVLEGEDGKWQHFKAGFPAFLCAEEARQHQHHHQRHHGADNGVDDRHFTGDQLQKLRPG